MNDRHTARRRSTRLAALTSAIVLLTAAAYMVVYIARWEWTRALISAAVLMVMLSIVSTVLVLSRLGELTALVRSALSPPAATDRSSASTVSPADTADALRAAGRAHATRHFDWLRANDRLGVFIPVLLGAGMILSAIAWFVERISGALAGATLDRRIAAQVPLDLPLGDRTQRPVTITSAPPRGSRRVTIGTAVVAALLLASGIELTRRVTQANEAEYTAPGTTSIVLDMRSMSGRDATAITTVLWSVCALQLDELPMITAIAADGPLVAFEVDRSLGRTAKRRVIGCLEDFTLDGVVGKVVELTTFRLPADEQSAAQSTRSNRLQRWIPKFVSSWGARTSSTG